MFITKKKLYEEIPDLGYLENKQLELWQAMLNKHVQLGDRFCNPWRNDNNPECYLEDKGGRIRMMDWAECMCMGCNYHGKDIFAIVMYQRNCTFNEALQYCFYELLNEKTIVRESRKSIKYNASNLGKPKKEVKIIYDIRQWSPQDEEYFGEHITKSILRLINIRVRPVEEYWINIGINNSYQKVVPKEATYAIHSVDNKIKIYTPATRTFLTNMDENSIGFVNQTGSYYYSTKPLIITVNVKSAAAIAAQEEFTDLFRVVFTHNEGSIPDNENFKILVAGFSDIFVLYDNDDAGIQAADRLVEHIKTLRPDSEYKTKAIHFNKRYNKNTYIDTFGNVKKVQDAFDMCKKFGKDFMVQELQKLLEL